MSSEQHWSVTVALVTSSLIGLVANSLLLLVFCRRRGLRTVSNRFTINLLFANLLSSLLLIPLLIADQKLTPQQDLQEATTYVHNITSLPDEIIFQEENDAEIVESDMEELIISDQLKVAIFAGNESEFGSSENATSSVKGTLCYVAQCTVSLVCTASILSVLLIGIDQYFAVIHSLRYHSYIDKFRSTALIITSWLFAIVFGILGAFSQNDSHLWHFCVENSTSATTATTTFSSVYAIIYFVLVILMPFLAVCIIYVCIYAAARNNSERMRKSTNKGNSHTNLDSYIQIRSAPKKVPSESRLDLKTKEEEQEESQSKETSRGLPKVHSAPNFSNLVSIQREDSKLEEELPVRSPITPIEPTTALHHHQIKVTRTHSERVGFITNLKYKISNASVFRYREETRAAKISILVIFMVLICYIPYGLAVVLNSHMVDLKIPRVYNFVSLVLLVLSDIISPFLFAYRNRRIQRELLRFFGVAPAKSSGNSLVRRNIVRPNSVLPSGVQRHNKIDEECERTEASMSVQPFLDNVCSSVPQVIITCKVEGEKAEKGSILKRVCSSKNWPTYKKCSFITVPESCWQTDSARGSFSSASTQISMED